MEDKIEADGDLTIIKQILPGKKNSNSKNQTPIEKNFNVYVRPWINIIDELRSKHVAEHIDLPTIAVMGDQSSGKSSVLEAITGIDLPRGTGIVTRCPLELKMESRVSEWTASISYTPPDNEEPTVKTLTSPSELSPAIIEAQNAIAGSNDDVRTERISLHVKSPDVPDLTVIDLPGIVHTPTKTQSSNVVSSIKELVEHYMMKEDTIILAVLPASVDFAICQVLDLAKKHDPQAKRTIAVVTKTDELGNDDKRKEELCQSMKCNNFHNIQEYYFVKNRSSSELREKLDLAKAIEKESEFFQSDPVFRELLTSNILGVPNLTAALTLRLVQAIQERLPYIVEQVNEGLKESQFEYDNLPQPMPDNEIEKILFYRSATRDLMTGLEKALSDNGQMPCYWIRSRSSIKEHFDKQQVLSYEEIENLKSASLASHLAGHPTLFSQWRAIFKRFAQQLNTETSKLLESEKALHSAQVIEHMRGNEPPTFLNNTLFRSLITKFLDKYANLAESCREEMENNLKCILLCYIAEHLRNYGLIHRLLLSIVSESVRKITEKSKKKIKFLFLIESMLFTQDDIFMDMYNQCSAPTANVNNSPAAQQSAGLFGQQSNTRNSSAQPAPTNVVKKDQVTVLFENLKSHVEIVARRLSDNIPSATLACLHKTFLEKLNENLQSNDRNQQVLQILSKPDPLKGKREFLIKKLQSLRNGADLLREFENRNLQSLADVDMGGRSIKLL